MNYAGDKAGLLVVAALALGACSDDVTPVGDGTTETTEGNAMTFGTETGDGDGDPATGDGDGDATGDGDGDATGDGDGDATGDGDGDPTGDGDGDATGDGDGDATGDGDGDMTGDGDGDMTGDGDGDMTGDGDGDADGSGDGDGDGGDLEPPTVLATTPEVLEDGVEPDVTIVVTFSEAMDSQTVTANTADDECTGAIQVSNDDFATCVQMAAAPSSQNDIDFELTPLDPLVSVGTYDIRVLTDVTDGAGNAMADPFTTSDPFLVRYYHTIVLDGVNDFAPEESFATASFQHTGYVAWDLDYLYLGMTAFDLSVDEPNTWFVGYLGGMPGTNMGALYNTQQPMMPFDARWHMGYRAADDFGGLAEWDGNMWVDSGVGPIPNSGDVAFSEDFVEMRIAWDDLDNPEEIAVHLGMLRDAPFNEASWAAVPSGSYNDGYDPDYSLYYFFDLTGSVVPVDHVPN